MPHRPISEDIAKQADIAWVAMLKKAESEASKNKLPNDWRNRIIN